MSSPVKAILGAFQIVGVIETDPGSLWEKVKDRSGLDRSEYDAYFDGASTAVALEVGKVTAFEFPVQLEELRNMWQGFNPPQSFRYLATEELSDIWNQQIKCVA